MFLQIKAKILKFLKDKRIRKDAFTLIELLIVIAILGILAAAIMVAINPGKRSAQARDAQRKSAVNAIANALIGYYTIAGVYPMEVNCDSSIGSVNPCQNNTGTDWNPGAYIYINLINDQAFLKKLPTDPKNNSTYFYRYEPRYQATSRTGWLWCGGSNPCNYYWIGALLEEPADPAKPIFRCTDDPTTPDGAGCKEVAQYNPLGPTTFAEDDPPE